MLRLLSLGITSMIPIFLTSHYMVRSDKNGDFHFEHGLGCMYTFSVSTSNSKEAFCMVYHTVLGKFQPTFSISGPGDGFKKRYAFLIRIKKT